MMETGYAKGEVCNRDGCKGIINEHPSDSSCSCHINPPCSYCTDSREYCPECGWEGRDEQLQEQSPSVSTNEQSEWDKRMERQRERVGTIRQMWMGKIPVDKFDYINEGHTHFSMKKIGVFPKGMTRSEVEEKVKGTFGGRFEQFNEEIGSFTYIAYTD